MKKETLIKGVHKKNEIMWPILESCYHFYSLLLSVDMTQELEIFSGKSESGNSYNDLYLKGIYGK